MSLFRYIFDFAKPALFGLTSPAAPPPVLLFASYDAARHGGPLEAHWQFADRLDADAANSRDVRHTLISRSRYENESNGYYAGSQQTHGVAVVGVGPRLRMQTKNTAFNQTIEREWEAWAAAVQLRRKLLCMSLAWKRDGEVFAVLQNNPGVANEINLDFQPIEAEVCQSPTLPYGIPGRIDGIISDQYGNVVAYEILSAHPGSGSYLSSQKADIVSARNVLHLFSLQRPGQHRGVPACSSTLNVGASSRRFREAVVKNAETSAAHTAAIETDLPPNSEEAPDTLQAMTAVPVANGTQQVLPRGWKLSAYPATQPAAGYSEFCKQQTAESARPLGMPHAVAAADASDANFSSLKTVHLWWRAQIQVDRADIDELVLERLFGLWWIERNVLRGIPLEIAIERPIPTHSFVWPVQPSADRNADAQAEDVKLRNGTLTLARAYSDAGLDIEDELNQMATDYGVTVKEMRRVLLYTFFPAAAQAVSEPRPVAAGDFDTVSKPQEVEEEPTNAVAQAT